MLVVASVGFTPLIGNPGCYPHDYNPETPAIDAPSQAQIDLTAGQAAAAAAALTAAAGRPDLAVILDLLMRAAVVIGAWFVSRTYAGKPITAAPKE